MKIFEGKWKHSGDDQDTMGRHEQGTPEKPNVRARCVPQESTWMDGDDTEHYVPTRGLELVKRVLRHAAAAGRNKDHSVAGGHTSMQGVSQRRPNCLTTATSIPGQVAAEDWDVACTGRDRLQGRGKLKYSNQSGWDGDVKDVEVFFQVSMRGIGGSRARRRHLARRTEITC